MRTPAPTVADIDELVAFLPSLYADGFKPIERWGGGVRDAQGAISMPWPEYDPVVTAFFTAAGRECWCDYDYVPAEAGQRITDAAFITHASLDDIKTLLTYCVRSERFTSGAWAAMIESGTIRALLNRLQNLHKPAAP